MSVQGCGKGYDVVMLALHGFDVIGLEVSQKGVSVAEEYACKELQMPQVYNFGAAQTKKYERGSVSFIHGDFFQPDCAAGEKFDVIYDYTVCNGTQRLVHIANLFQFLCAIHPTLRAQWASRMADLLVPDGLLICLEFPLFKDLCLPGPPWPLKGVYWNLLSEGGDGIVNSSVSKQNTGKGQFERKWYIKPERSYDNGKGTDMLSIYARK